MLSRCTCVTRRTRARRGRRTHLLVARRVDDVALAELQNQPDVAERRLEVPQRRLESEHVFGCERRLRVVLCQNTELEHGRHIPVVLQRVQASLAPDDLVELDSCSHKQSTELFTEHTRL